MKIKRSLAALILVIIPCITLPVVANAATVSSEYVPASEQLEFDPLVYMLVLIAASLICLLAVLLVEIDRLRRKELLIGKGLYDFNAALPDQINVTSFDYSKMETPSELINNSVQSYAMVEEVINRLSTTKPPHVPRHQRRIDERLESILYRPHIRLVPEMKHARWKATYVPLHGKPNELEELLRKIS